MTEAARGSSRAERTRAAIADALLSLLDEGDLQPTATRIAERAGISLRLIYHHFGDMEGLFREACERETLRLMARAKPVARDLPFDQRLERFVDQRANILEWMTPVCRASALQEPFSATLQGARRRAHQAAQRELTLVFAEELTPLDPAEHSAVVAAAGTMTSWPAWEQLRYSGSSVEEGKAAMCRTLRALLAPGG
jgi:AcrR family transcriptional regulator